MAVVESQYRNAPAGLTLPDDRQLFILVGANNTGKSSILQGLNKTAGASGDYLPPGRFEVQENTAVTRDFETDRQRAHKNRKNIAAGQSEVQAPDPVTELLALKNSQRKLAIKWHNEYFGELELKHLDDENEYSATVLTVDGRRISEQGSGSRTILGILVKLFDPNLTALFVDEPEISIEPQTQRKLLRLLKLVSRGEAGIGAKKIYLGTHSHLFLDREHLANNYVVRKGSDGMAVVKQVESEQELHQLVFQLLGNSPEDLFFPRNVIVVEGPSDQIFLSRLLHLRESKPIAVHFADGTPKIEEAAKAIDQMLKSTSYIPLYRNKMCILVDQLKADKRLLEQWRAFLEDSNRVVELTKDGIEHYYPLDQLESVTGVPKTDLPAQLDNFLAEIREGEPKPAFGRFKGGKRELADEVVIKIEKTHLADIDPEISSFLEMVENFAKW